LAHAKVDAGGRVLFRGRIPAHAAGFLIKVRRESVLFADLVPLFAESLLDLLQQVPKRRQAVTGLERKIGAGEKRSVVVGREREPTVGERAMATKRPAAGFFPSCR
jgi:hypothetical protein